jgi:hypothetical protein
MRKSIRVALARVAQAAWLGLASPVFAAGGLGGSYVVDDATITPNGHCQLESWIRAIDGGEGEASSVPACSAGNIEWSASIDRRAGAGLPATTLGVGAKWVAGDLDRDGRAWGVAGGALWSGGALVSEQAYVPVSISAGIEHPWLIHLNAGARRTIGTGWRAIAGVGVETALDADWSLLAEYFDAQSAEKTVQAGVRWSVTQNADVDLVVGHTRDAIAQSWLTLGLNLAF